MDGGPPIDVDKKFRIGRGKERDPELLLLLNTRLDFGPWPERQLGLAPDGDQDRLLASWKFLRSHGLKLCPNLAAIQQPARAPTSPYFQVSRSHSGFYTDTVPTMHTYTAPKAPPTHFAVCTLTNLLKPSKFKLPNGVLRGTFSMLLTNPCHNQ
ncbi:hypothetical protein DKX38_015750 [Salix brachista]|uniref:Uncharacterized protein n=1 Tax=Salix brachista TaxID=2182728 RepID=A0A5N5L631_9ROSI|nr:hypothetical protein DKX38_015750 [Salix brachista]